MQKEKRDDAYVSRLIHFSLFLCFCNSREIFYVLKIFTESADEFTLVLFGSEATQNPVTDDENIFFCEEEMQQAKIDWLRFIDKEIRPSKFVNGDCKFVHCVIASISKVELPFGQ